MTDNSMDRLEDQLNSYTDKNIIPMHMPGHKRNTGLVPMYLQNDITEIEGFDDLHRPSGILKKLEE
ncbi:MAG: amino acid decarboxylase, partial [Clostridiales bacterium]|nr:amino acid decarboxylase [Clostridiales bacterium]